MNRILLMVVRNLLIVPWAWLKLCWYAAHPQRYPDEKMYRHIQFILRRAVTGGNVKLLCTGTENIPQEGGFMLYANHQGMFDVLAIAATCDRAIGAVLKQELVKVPFLRQVAICTKSYPMNREDVRQSLTVIQNVTGAVEQGKPYLIFPEGTRNRQNFPLLEFHGGSFRCAIKSKCPIVPIALIDSFRVLDEKGCKPLSTEIHYLKPIPYQEYEGLKASQVAELVKERIQEKIMERTGEAETP